MNDRLIRVKRIQLRNVGDDGSTQPVPTRSSAWAENCQGDHVVVSARKLAHLEAEVSRLEDLAECRMRQWVAEERECGELKLQIEKLKETEAISKEIFLELREAVGLKPGDGVSLLKFVKEQTWTR